VQNAEKTSITNWDHVYSCKDGTHIDGAYIGTGWWEHGMAQYSNDRIVQENNNAEFAEVEVSASFTADSRRADEACVTRVYLKASRDIAVGEEICVSYGLPYWAKKIKRENALPEATVEIIRSMVRTARTQAFLERTKRIEPNP
jgi:hypothetical protein